MLCSDGQVKNFEHAGTHSPICLYYDKTTHHYELLDGDVHDQLDFYATVHQGMRLSGGGKLRTGSNAPSLQVVDFASVAGNSTRPATVSNAAALSTLRASAGPVRGPTLGLVSNPDALCLAGFVSDAGGHSVADCAESNCVAVLKHPSHIGRTRARPQLGFRLRFEAPFPC